VAQEPVVQEEPVVLAEVLEVAMESAMEAVDPVMAVVLEVEVEAKVMPANAPGRESYQ